MLQECLNGSLEPEIFPVESLISFTSQLKNHLFILFICHIVISDGGGRERERDPLYKQSVDARDSVFDRTMREDSLS